MLGIQKVSKNRRGHRFIHPGGDLPNCRHPSHGPPYNGIGLRQRDVTPSLVGTSGEERMKVIRSVHGWALKPYLNVHRIIGVVVRSSHGISRERLVEEVSQITNSKNAYGAVASLLTSKSNAYGRVLEDVGGVIRLHPDVEEEVRSVHWS